MCNICTYHKELDIYILYIVCDNIYIPNIVTMIQYSKHNILNKEA